MYNIFPPEFSFKIHTKIIWATVFNINYFLFLEKSARVRRKERERKVTPLSELTDTSDYVAKPPSRKLSENISGKLSEKMIQSSNWTAI